MLTIRFSRKGKRKKPFYRIIISENTKDTQADFVELLGSYNPHTKEVVLKKDRIEYWIGTGAQTSNSVQNLFIREGILKGKKAKAVRISDRRRAIIDELKKKNEPAPQPEAKTEAPAASEAAPTEAAAEKPVEASAEAVSVVETPAEKAVEETKTEAEEPKA